MDPLADLKLEPADYEEYETSQSVFVEDLGGDQPEADPGGDVGGGQGAQAGGSESAGGVEGEQAEQQPPSLPVPAQFIPGHGGKPLLVNPFNYFYVKNTPDKYDPAKQHYRCQKQRNPDIKCPGTATTKEVNGQMLLIKLNEKHNHPSSFNQVKEKQFAIPVTCKRGIFSGDKETSYGRGACLTKPNRLVQISH